MKANGPASFLQAPADIHVIARGAVNGIESADRLKRRFSHHEIATWYMLRQIVVDENVNRASGRLRDTFRDGPVAGRRKIRSADSHMRAIAKGKREVVKPMWIGVGVVIDVGDDLTARGSHPGISCRAQPLVLSLNDLHAGVFPSNRCCPIRRAIAYDNL